MPTPELRIPCNSCTNRTRHEVLQQFEEPKPTGEIINWQIVRCAGCDSISFYKEHLIEGESDFEVIEAYVYPVRQYLRPREFVQAPANIELLYQETIEMYNRDLFRFCAAGLRMLVEAICTDRDISDGPQRDYSTGELVPNRRCSKLHCKIEGLAEKGHLTENSASVLHEHRYLGNEALHELAIPARETLKVAIGIIEHVMEGLYTIQARGDGLRQIRMG